MLQHVLGIHWEPQELDFEQRCPLGRRLWRHIRPPLVNRVAGIAHERRDIFNELFSQGCLCVPPLE